MSAPSDAFYEAVERRIEWLTLVLSAAGAVFASVRWGWRAGIGVAVGGTVSWLNFRWLDQGIGQLLRATTGTAEIPPKRVSRWIYGRFLGRLLLIVGVVYVILKTAWLPGRAVLAGLFSLICAALLEVSYEMMTGFREPTSRP
jgi:hypothetical protein